VSASDTGIETPRGLGSAVFVFFFVVFFCLFFVVFLSFFLSRPVGSVTLVTSPVLACFVATENPWENPLVWVDFLGRVDKWNKTFG